ncbi:unnamed protein product [Linum trigynum]|uniref:Basic proline-rich protein-like n=1 Tax=Linum trigynum TaxID=586398 RepID=A0AAV2FED5_9ROSI
MPRLPAAGLYLSSGSRRLARYHSLTPAPGLRPPHGTQAHHCPGSRRRAITARPVSDDRDRYRSRTPASRPRPPPSSKHLGPPLPPAPGLCRPPDTRSHHCPDSRRQAFTSLPVPGARARYRSRTPAPGPVIVLGPRHPGPPFSWQRRAFTSRPVPEGRARYHSRTLPPGLCSTPGTRAHHFPVSRRRAFTSRPVPGSQARYNSQLSGSALLSTSGPTISPAPGSKPSPLVCYRSQTPAPEPTIFLAAASLHLSSGSRRPSPSSFSDSASRPGPIIILVRFSTSGPTISPAPGSRPSPLVRFPAPRPVIVPGPRLQESVLLPAPENTIAPAPNGGHSPLVRFPEPGPVIVPGSRAPPSFQKPGSPLSQLPATSLHL